MIASVIQAGYASINNQISGAIPKDFGDLGRMFVYFQGAGEHKQFFRNLGSKHLIF